MKYFLIAGEASGDIHGAKLMQWIKHFDPDAQFQFFGGDQMAAQGGTLIKHYKDTAFMGAVDVIKNLGKIKQNLSLALESIKLFSPDVIILIDYPGFNLRIAKLAKQAGFKVFYYISPKIWAWNKKRAHIIKRYIDKMFVIFPFEIDFYKKYDYEVEYLGNPTVDEVHEYLQNPFDTQKFYSRHGLDPQKHVIALLPGSRKQEVKHLLPHMIETAQKMSNNNYQFAIAGMSHLPKELYKSAFEHKIPVIWDASYDLLRIAYAAVVTSGTATLETALFNVPQVVVYKTDTWQYLIGSLIVRVKYFSLVNIILNKQAVKELLQKHLTKSIIQELSNILNDKQYYQQILSDYKKLRTILGEPGAAERTAKRIVELLNQ